MPAPGRGPYAAQARPACVLTVILADAELELVPADIAGHPSVRNSAKNQDRKPTEILLDQNVHAAAAKQLPEGERRGRPDIVHYTLLTLLESPLAKSGNLQVAIHTRHAELIRVRGDTRLPRGEGRMQGLLAKVLREGSSNQPGPLVWSEGSMAAKSVLDKVAKGPVVRLDEGGEAAAPDDVALLGQDGHLTVVLGAFPSGSFSEAWRKAAPKAVSVWPAALNAWAIAAEMVAAHRRVWGPHFPNAR
jgi:rRNA small subunit pseudouridine methyltransferase Nep1